MRKLSARTSPLEHDPQSRTTFIVHVRSVTKRKALDRNHITNSTIGFMLAWSVVSLLTYMAHNYHGMLVCRFILGITEAPVRRPQSEKSEANTDTHKFYPGALYMISMFYTKKEMATRMAILYTGNMLASSFSGLIAAAVFQLDGRHNLAGWQWLFVCLSNMSEVSEPGLTFADHSRRHLDRHWNCRHLHAPR